MLKAVSRDAPHPEMCLTPTFLFVTKCRINSTLRPMFRLDFESDFVDAFAAGARDILCSGRPLSENVFTRSGAKRERERERERGARGAIPLSLALAKERERENVYLCPAERKKERKKENV